MSEETPEAEKPALGPLLRAWRRRALLSQSQLADQAGLSVRTIGRMETNAMPCPRTTSAQLLADALGLNPQERALLASVIHDERPVPAKAKQAEAATGSAPPPRQLPGDVVDFVGRVSELAALTTAPPPAITAIDGMAGIGKTALAVHAAHQLASRFTDGQLFIDLHGYTQGLAPVEPSDALGRLLNALGIPADQIPRGLEDRAALYRSRIEGRKILLVLDNAVSESQVLPLLPGAKECQVLITSRRRLTMLNVAQTLSLDVLPGAEAVDLFMSATGGVRLSRTPRSVLSEIVECCGMLPLTIRIAAGRLRSRVAWDASFLLDRLREHEPRLAALTAGRHNITVALDLSYRDLTPEQRQVYRVLGLHPGANIGTQAAAALLGMPVVEVERHMEALLDAHLLMEPVPGRHQFHDLTRQHAAGAAARDEPDSDRRAAVARMLDYYCYTTSVAMSHCYPYEADERPEVPAFTSPAQPLRDAEQAAAWLDLELANLLAAAELAAAGGWPDQLNHLSATLERYLRTCARYGEGETLHSRALASARACGDRAGEVAALHALGDTSSLRGRHDEASDYFTQALDIAVAGNMRTGWQRALNGIGWVRRRQGLHEQAAEAFLQALEITRADNRRTGQLDALTGLGDVLRLQGKYQQASACLLEGLRIAQDIGHRTGELKALSGLGHIRRAQELYDEAAGYFAQALRAARATGHRTGELDTMTSLADLHRLRGDFAEAVYSYNHALEVAQEIGNHNWQFEALQGLGRLHHVSGRSAEALDAHREALRIATDLDQPDDQARAHDGLAHAYEALGQYELARRHWQQALDILTKLGAERTEDEEANVTAIREYLAKLGRPRVS
ncbi:ATP-binding protein [Nonomuraea sp. NPDC003214]